VKRHRLCFGKWEHQTDSRIVLRAHGTKDISRFRLLLPHDPWPGAPTCPDPGLGAALANAHFVLKPDIDLLQLDLRG
jgi:hypothetical protein